MSTPHQPPQQQPQQALPAPPSRATQPPLKPVRPWYKKWWIWVIVVVALIGIGSMGKDSKEVGVEETPIAQSEEPIDERVETPQSLPQAASQVGELLTVAEANLELGGYEVEAVSDDGSGIWVKGNWEVVEQEQNGNTVLLTVKSTITSDTTPSTETNKTNSQGLTGYTAVRACGNLWETALKNEYPASKIKIHTTMGVLAQRLDDDDAWFIKIDGSIDKNTINVECSVTGSETSPVVDPIAVY